MTSTEKLKKVFKFIFLMNFVVFTPSAIPEESFWERFEIPTRQFQCLVEVLYYEARNQPSEGVLAVAEVVLNRVNSPRYPKSVCAVSKQQLVKGVYQFSFWKNKSLLKQKKDRSSWNEMERLAQQAVELHEGGFQLVDEAMYYYNPKKANPKWARSSKLKFVRKIGDHKFYKRVKD